jgi:hypothetical protein
MNIGNLIVLIVMIGLVLLMWQRTERKRKLIFLAVLVIPAWMIYQWSALKGQQVELKWALGIALALNLLFWLFWGRTHPAGSSDSIKVIGTEE